MNEFSSMYKIFAKKPGYDSNLLDWGKRSTLLATTMRGILRLEQRISANTMHSAVWVWMPLMASTTRIMRSMILAPPIIVRIKDACPGQSTSVIWTWSGQQNVESPTLSFWNTQTRNTHNFRLSIKWRILELFLFGNYIPQISSTSKIWRYHCAQKMYEGNWPEKSWDVGKGRTLCGCNDPAPRPSLS